MENHKEKILVVDDEASIRRILETRLSMIGYNVITAADGEEALLVFKKESPNLVILDVMMPKLDGYGVCQEIRKESDVPIIMLTARGDEADRITGLDHGADDYVLKPFSLPLLFARTRALLRRTNPSIIEEAINIGNIEIDTKALRVTINKTQVHLGPTEFRLLEHFMSNPGRVYSREQLLDAVWGRNIYVEARTVDVHIGRLRKILNENGAKNPIRTVRSAGYSFEINE